jgi:hypothetical protein
MEYLRNPPPLESTTVSYTYYAASDKAMDNWTTLLILAHLGGIRY